MFPLLDIRINQNFRATLSHPFRHLQRQSRLLVHSRSKERQWCVSCAALTSENFTNPLF